MDSSYHAARAAVGRGPGGRRTTAFRLALGLLLGLGACGTSDEEARDEPQPLASPVVAPPLPAAPDSPALVLSGEIAADANRTARVFPRVGGQVVRLPVELGDEVRQGQVLAVLQSTELAALQNQHTAGTADLAVARKNLAVAQELLAAGLGAEQDVYKARAEVARAAGTAAKNHQQLGQYSVGPTGLYELRAPLAGFVTEKNLTAGMRFAPANLRTAFTVANLDSVWVLANVFEADLARVHEGQAVRITTLSYPDHVLPGRISRVLQVLDPQSKVLKVRCTLPNPHHLLKPGMHAQVQVLDATP